MTDDVKQISFRVTGEEYKQLERVAGILSDNGKIRNNSVGTLCKALTFVKINEFIQIELLEKALRERDEALEKRNVPPQGFGYS